MKRFFNKNHVYRYIIICVAVVLAVISVVAAVNVYDYCRDGNCVPTGILSNRLLESEKAAKEAKLQREKDAAAVKALGQLTVPSYVNIDYIAPSRARTEVKLTGLHNIVIHYTGNPGTTAKQNRSYFGQKSTTVCSHFLIGLDGEIIQCIPLDEQSAASNHRNVDTISIEVCHPDKSGRFNEKTYDALVRLTAWLCNNTDLDDNDLIRHHDITGKECPKHFVNDVSAWEQFKVDVKSKLKPKNSDK